MKRPPGKCSIKSYYFPVVFSTTSYDLSILEEKFTFILCSDFIYMEKIEIRETPKTPSVIFDPREGLFEIRGKSIPENSDSFYSPLLHFMDSYRSNPADSTVFNVRFEFFNTSSTNRIHALFKRFENLFLDDHDVLVRWYYENGDENMRDAGRDFKTILQVPFELIEVEEL